MNLVWKYHWKGFFKALPGNLGVLAPVMVVGCFVASYFAVVSVNGLVTALRAEKQVAKQQEVSLTREPLKAADYALYVDVMQRLSPTVKFETAPQGAGLLVSVAHADAYAEFMYALASMQSYAESVLWEASELCIAGCEGGAAKAVVKGYKQRFVLK